MTSLQINFPVGILCIYGGANKVICDLNEPNQVGTLNKTKLPLGLEFYVFITKLVDEECHPLVSLSIQSLLPVNFSFSSLER